MAFNRVLTIYHCIQENDFTSLKSNHALQSELNETLRLQYKVSQSLVLSSSWKLNSCYVV